LDCRQGIDGIESEASARGSIREREKERRSRSCGNLDEVVAEGEERVEGADAEIRDVELRGQRRR